MPPFTFFGDLLGIGAAYQLSADTAHRKLNAFYNSAFAVLPNTIDVEMYSDSILIRGNNAADALDQIAGLYRTLLQEGMLLRGAMVSGRLTFEPRIERKNFRKQLPADDTLARAAGLEKAYKGARFILETQLAHELLEAHPDWHTNEGYLLHIAAENANVLRKICPTPEGRAYEYLYPWTHGDEQRLRPEQAQVLRNTMAMATGSARKHYRETLKLIHRARLRENVTRRADAVPPN